MSRSIRDLRELICLSRFGFRSDENGLDNNHDNHTTNTNNNQSNNSILFYFDSSILNNWLEVTSSRLEKLRSLPTITLINFIYFWLTQLDKEHKQSLFQMEFELFIEHLLLAFTPNDIDSLQINQFARNILHDIDKQIGIYSIENDYNFIYHIDIFNRYKRDDQYRTLLADLPNELIININNSLHLQWMLAIRAFGLLSICTAAVEFFEKIQKTLEKNPTTGELYSSQINDGPLFNNQSDQCKNRILTALRKDYIDVIQYFIKTNQITGESIDEQNRNILFHALPIGNISTIEHLLKSNLKNFDINSVTQSGNSLLHLCISLQRLDIMELLIKYYPNIDLNQRNQQDAAPIHLAIIYNDLDIIRCLIRSGVNTKLTMKTKTCSQLSIEFNHERLIEFFCEPV
ncbi:unnamed protein product [Rotaria magnacalcarata]|uniref:SIPAR domain-containing protein n=2 Tax=Rotaria magnacalcarata TaxID=392030 RepID=A0A814HJC8_9BILA|nr:unnamed protein product [Rotaria magnacalcarata]CAF1438583.1 unnamed protein product [Rotaria magnacalcarata]CAF3859994.1 unnamed protein product [Rotaria magnacalcarata]CAF3899412.1 unnamed protein product [Rotaria magnacalcarata]